MRVIVFHYKEYEQDPKYYVLSFEKHQTLKDIKTQIELRDALDVNSFNLLHGNYCLSKRKDSKTLEEIGIVNGSKLFICKHH